MNYEQNCKKIQPLLASFVDEELSPGEREQVRGHLAGCAVCESIAHDFASTARLVATLPPPPALSAGFEAALARRIADGSLAPKPLSPMAKLRQWWEDAAPTAPRLAPVLATVAVTLLAVAIPTGLVLTGRNTSPGMRQPVATASVSPSDAAALVASDPTLAELWNEHRTFAAAQPLGDPAQAVGGEN